LENVFPAEAACGDVFWAVFQEFFDIFWLA
jgi:hypothetical protein